MTVELHEVVAWAGVLTVLGLAMTVALFAVLAGDARRYGRTLGLGGIVVVSLLSLWVLLRPLHVVGTSPYVSGLVSVNCHQTAVHSAFTEKRPSVDECRSRGLSTVATVLSAGPVTMGVIAFGSRRRRDASAASHPAG